MPVRVPSAIEIGLGRAVASSVRGGRLNVREIVGGFGINWIQSTAQETQTLDGR